eukprot:TRINITY_DN9113_c0_g1_i1.p1 TRINITY_DN9113_c0_g1~~TRINITY_DN9113_c0_g1_i1.p1  ORF type:complete len:277 (+),score=55.19 TRINITY_DN9113_c0_g1_i1:1504-2334(+)
MCLGTVLLCTPFFNYTNAARTQDPMVGYIVLGTAIICSAGVTRTSTPTITVTGTGTVTGTQEEQSAATATVVVGGTRTATLVADAFASNGSCTGSVGLGSDTMAWGIGTQAATGEEAVEVCMSIKETAPATRSLLFSGIGTDATFTFTYAGTRWTLDSNGTDFTATSVNGRDASLCGYTTLVLPGGVSLLYTPSGTTANTTLACSGSSSSSSSSKVWLIVVAICILLAIVAGIVAAVVCCRKREREKFTKIEFTDAVDLLQAKEMMTGAQDAAPPL